MRIPLPLTLACLSFPALVACGSSEAKQSTSEAQITFQTLITGDWQMPAGEEGYYCARKTIDQDMYVDGFEAINPPGTHHTLLTMGAPGAPDGVAPCNAATNGPLSLFGSGVGTDRLMLPPGVALKIPAGTQLLLNLHLYNTGADVMTGLSGERVHVVPENEVSIVAESILAGTVAISIPAGQTKTTTGFCTMTGDTTLIAVAPHMHKLGVYEKVTAESSIDGDVVINDAPYDFNEQSFHLIDPVHMAGGDKVQVDCTHDNTTQAAVTFGESSDSEMCFAGIYRYPATGNLFICSDDFLNMPRPDAGF